jgi:hypothetical protein
MTTTQVSPAFKINTQDNIGIQLDWTGAPVGTFQVAISSNHVQDLNGNITFAGNFITLPLSPAITAAGTPDNAYIDLNQMTGQFVQVTYTATSGTGTLNGTLVGKAI